MKHLFLNYELSKLAKEKGFNEPCFYIIDNKETLRAVELNGWLPSIHILADTQWKNEVLAPLYQQIVDWFREKHGIFIHIEARGLKYHSYHIQYNYEKLIDEDGDDVGDFKSKFEQFPFSNSHEESRDLAIEEALKLIP